MPDSAALKVGDTAPDFTLSSDDGKQVSLSSLRGQRVIVYFYPKDDSPGCTTQSCGFRDNFPVIQEKNAVVLGINPGDKASHQAFRTKNNLPFSLLVDPDHKVSETYGAWGPKEKDGEITYGMIRSHFVVDEQGKLVDVQQPVTPTDSVSRALEAIGA